MINTVCHSELAGPEHSRRNPESTQKWTPHQVRDDSSGICRYGFPANRYQLTAIGWFL